MTVQTQTVATLTLGRRLWKTPAISIYFLLALLFSAVAVVAVRETARWIAVPSLNLPLLSDLTVRSVVGYWDGTHDGDRLVAINGIAVASTDQLEAIERALPVGPAAARFARDTAQFDLVGKKESPKTAQRIALACRCVAGIVLFLIGALTFLLRPGARSSWLFFLFCFSLGLLLLTVLALHHDLWLRNIVPFSMLGIAAGFEVHFFAEFPLRSPVLSGRPRAALLPHLPAMVLIPALVRSMQRGEHSVPRPLLWLICWGIVATLTAVALLFSQWARARRIADTQAQAQVRALAVATIVGLLVPALWTAAWLFGWFEFPGVAHMGSIPVVLFAGLIGHTLVRHNAFDVDRFTAAVVGYAAAVGVLGLCFLLALVGMPLVLGRLGVARSPELFVVLTSLAFAAFLPLFRRLKARIDRGFSRSGVDAARQAELLGELSFTIQTGDRGRALRAALVAATTVRCNRAELWTIEDGAPSFSPMLALGAARPQSASPPLPRESVLGRELAASDEARGVAGLALRLFSPQAQEELWAHELALAVPVKVHARLVGFLGIGRKLSGGALDSAETAFLATIATNLAIVFEQAGQESTRLGRYRLGKRLGTGGMAEVYLASQLGPGGFERKVALKRPLPHLMDDTVAVTMFLDEARISAQLSHRNIVAIHEVDKQDGHYLIAMEYVDGPTLRSAILWSSDGRSPVPLDVALSIGLGILAALAYAHTATDSSGEPLHLVHRDVTPANVMVSFRGEVKLMDFGIARAAERNTTTRTGSIKGTVPYMSPEQSSGKAVDRRSDLYSAGATLYELFTLVRAFPEGPEDFDPTPATWRRTDLPPAMDSFFARTLTFRPDGRPVNAEEMAKELRAAVGTVVPANEEAVAKWITELARRAATGTPTTTTGAKSAAQTGRVTVGGKKTGLSS